MYLVPTYVVRPQFPDKNLTWNLLLYILPQKFLQLYMQSTSDKSESEIQFNKKIWLWNFAAAVVVYLFRPAIRKKT